MKKIQTFDTSLQHPRPTVILLCAGRSERFKAHGGGGNKLDAKLSHLSVKDHVLQSVQASGLAYLIVEPKDLAHVHNPGMGDSIAFGVAQSIKGGLADPSRLPSGWLILPADLPLVQSETLVQVASVLAGAQQNANHQLTQKPDAGGQAHVHLDRTTVAPVYGGQRGHPVGFSKAFLKDLLSLKGDQGAKELLQAYPPQLLEVQDRGCVLDVDTPELLEEARNWWQTNLSKH